MAWPWLSVCLLWAALPPLPGPEAVRYSGTVIDALGEPVPGVELALRPELGWVEQGQLELGVREQSEPLAAGQSRSDGSFALEVERPGLYRMLLRHGGRELYRLLWLDGAEEDDVVILPEDKRAAVRVLGPDGGPVQGEVRCGVTRRLSPLLGQEAMPASVVLEGGRGRCPTDSRGRGLGVASARGLAPAAFGYGAGMSVKLRPGQSVRVLVREPDGSAARHAVISIAGMAWGVTDEQGRAKLTVGERSLRWHFASTSGASRRLVLPRVDGAERVAVVLEPPVPVSGRVLRKDTDEPLAGALVVAQGKVAYAGEDGGFDLELMLPLDGRDHASVLAVADGFARRTLRANLRTGPAELRFELEPGLDARGRVVDAEGHGLADARIDLGLETVLSDATGGFRAPASLPRLPAPIRVSKPGYAPLRQEVVSREEAGALEPRLLRGRTAYGWVLDGEGSPVPSASVQLRARRSGRGYFPFDRGPPRAEAITDAQGRFEASHLAAQRLDLRVSAPGFAPATVPGLEIPAGEGEVELGTVTLDPGHTLLGFVVDQQGAPLAGVEVELGAGSAGWTFRHQQGPLVTGPDGSFSVGDLPEKETVGLWARLDGFVPAARQVSVPAPEPLEIVLEPAGEIRGRVVDDSGLAVEGARVQVAAGPSRSRPDGRPQSQTGADGGFALRGLAFGRYRLAVQAEGFLAGSVPLVELAPGDPLEPLHIELRRGATLEVWVSDSEGERASGATVGLWSNTIRQNGRRFQSGGHETDAKGYYRATGLPLGRMQVRALRAGEEGRASVDVQPGENEVEIELVPSLVLSGRVVAPDGSPVPGARIEWIGSQSSSRVGTGSDGEFEKKVRTGDRWTLKAHKEDVGTSAKVEVEIGEVSFEGLELVLEPGTLLAGRIEGPGVDEMSDIEVAVTTLGNRMGTRWASPDFEGRFELPNLEPGEWRVRARRRGSSRSAERWVTITPGMARAEVELVLEPGLSLGGLVLRGDEPASGLLVNASGIGVDGGDGTQTDGEGRFRMEDLQEGSYEIEVLREDLVPAHRQRIELQTDEELLIELAGTRISGRVLSRADGLAIPGAQVLLRPEIDGARRRSRSASDLSDGEGRFRFVDVAEGAYVLSFQATGYASMSRALVLDGSPAEVEVELAPPGTAVLQLLAASAVANRSVQITVRRPGAVDLQWSRRFVVDGEGRVTVSGLGRGRWQLDLALDDHLGRAVTEAGEESIPVRLERGGHLILVVPELLESQRRTPITLRAADGGVPIRVPARTALLSGRGRLGPLRPGVWAIEVELGDGRTTSARVQIVGGQTVTFTVEG